MKLKSLLVAWLLALGSPAMAQFTVIGTSTVVTDTLHYFLNKQHFKLAEAMSPTFPYYKAPTAATQTSSTGVTHCGSIFMNSDTSLQVTGLEAWVMNNNSNVNAGKIVTLYLFNVSPLTGLPVYPFIDSVYAAVSTPCPDPGIHCPPVLISGNFNVPRTVKGNFAVLMRNYSGIFGDTIRYCMTSTLTKTNTNTYPGASYYKTGEGLGVIRKGGVFYKTTNLLEPGFGAGTDHEFCVAPRVKFTLKPSYRAPISLPDSVLWATAYTLTNTSSPEFTNHQFNLNEFYRQLGPFQAQPANGFLPDTVMDFNFDDDDRLDLVPYPWGRVQNLFLAPNANTVTKYFDTSGAFYDGTMIARYRKMTTCYSTRIIGTVTIATHVYSLQGVWPGFAEQQPMGNVLLFPNPAVNGKTSISGLQGQTTIQVYNLMGQLLATEVTHAETADVDLLKQPAGVYLVRMVTAGNRSRTIKVVNQKE